MTGRVGTAVAVTATWGLAVAVNRSLRRIRGSSMAPTLEPGDVVLTLPMRRPARGEVVIVRDPRDPSHVQVKRLLGLPGERLRIHRGRLHVDGIAHPEHYAAGNGPDGELDVPHDHVAVLGDARDASTDSRTYGAVPLALVDARAVARVRPHPRLLRADLRPVQLADGADGEAA